MANICGLECQDLGNGINKVLNSKTDSDSLQQWLLAQSNLVFLVRDDYSEVLAVAHNTVEDVGIKLRKYAKDLGIEDCFVYICCNDRGSLGEVCFR